MKSPEFDSSGRPLVLKIANFIGSYLVGVLQFVWVEAKITLVNNHEIKKQNFRNCFMIKFCGDNTIGISKWKPFIFPSQLKHYNLQKKNILEFYLLSGYSHLPSMEPCSLGVYQTSKELVTQMLWDSLLISIFHFLSCRCLRYLLLHLACFSLNHWTINIKLHRLAIMLLIKTLRITIKLDNNVAINWWLRKKSLTSLCVTLNWIEHDFSL